MRGCEREGRAAGAPALLGWPAKEEVACGPRCASGCSAWLAGIREWEYGWLRVLKRSGDHLRDVYKQDLGVDVEVYQPHHDVASKS